MPETDIRQFNINFGPQHPAAHGVLRLGWSSTARWWSSTIPSRGLLHHGGEELIERETYLQAISCF